MGCKRILISNAYYPSLLKPHVTLEAAGLERVDGNTIFSSAGNEFEVDVIVCATGFEAVEPPFAPLISANGRSLAQSWSEGMQAFSSVTVAGFPNLFIMNGPNTGLGHNSVIFVVESQVSFIVQALDFMRATGVTVIDTRVEAEESYVASIRERSAGTVWLDGGCTNWYVDPRTHRLTVTWPDYAYAFRQSNGSFDESAFATS
jgi:cation diffusion facilitator CzcD-associated flavoprotein CzcO